MFVWNRDGVVRRYEVVVARDIAKLTDQVKQLFPNEKVEVRSNGRDVVLAGTVSSKDVAEKLVGLSAGFVEKKDDIVNLLQVAAPRTNQVLLRVRFAEVSRQALTELGVNLFTSPTGINNTLGRVSTQQFPGAEFSDLSWSKSDKSFGSDVTSATGKVTFSDFLNLFVLSEKYDLGVLIRALSTKGLFQSLAEPNLVAEMSRDSAGAQDRTALHEGRNPRNLPESHLPRRRLFRHSSGCPRLLRQGRVGPECLRSGAPRRHYPVSLVLFAAKPARAGTSTARRRVTHDAGEWRGRASGLQ